MYCVITCINWTAIPALLTILCYHRYENGGFLSPNDEKVVVEKLLSYHPRADEKIGCGIDGIMVSILPNLLYQIGASSSNKLFPCVPVTFQTFFPFVPKNAFYLGILLLFVVRTTKKLTIWLFALLSLSSYRGSPLSLIIRICCLD